jgi:hypothetical protein
LIPEIVDWSAGSSGAAPGPPASEAGDLAVVWTGNAGNSVMVTTPAGWTAVGSATGAPTATLVAKLCFRINTSDNQTMGGFVGSGRIIGMAWRNARLESGGDMNGVVQVTGSGGAFDYPALTMTEPSLVLLGHLSDDIEVHGWPAGFTQVVSYSSPAIAVALSDTELTSWAGASVSQTGSQLGITFSLAVLGALG